MRKTKRKSSGLTEMLGFLFVVGAIFGQTIDNNIPKWQRVSVYPRHLSPAKEMIDRCKNLEYERLDYYRHERNWFYTTSQNAAKEDKNQCLREVHWKLLEDFPQYTELMWFYNICSSSGGVSGCRRKIIYTPAPRDTL